MSMNRKVCKDCLFEYKCELDTLLYHAVDRDNCDAFMDWNFELEYITIDTDLIDELLSGLEDDCFAWDFELELLADSSEEWLEMSDRKWRDLDAWDLEESEWDLFLLED